MDIGRLFVLFFLVDDDCSLEGELLLELSSLSLAVAAHNLDAVDFKEDDFNACILSCCCVIIVYLLADDVPLSRGGKFKPIDRDVDGMNAFTTPRHKEMMMHDVNSTNGRRLIIFMSLL